MIEKVIIGNKYIERKTSKVATVLAYDDTKKSYLLNDGSKDFNVKITTFRNGWSEVVDDAQAVQEEPVEAVVAEQTEEPVVSTVEPEEAEPVDYYNPSCDLCEFSNDCGDFKVNTFGELVNFISKFRDCTLVEEDAKYTIFVDNVAVFEYTEGHMRMLPDIYMYSKWDSIVNFSVNMNSDDFLGISADTSMELASVLNAIKCSLLRVNMYGYIIS